MPGLRVKKKYNYSTAVHASVRVITRLEAENRRLRAALEQLINDKTVTYSVRVQRARAALTV